MRFMGRALVAIAAIVSVVVFSACSSSGSQGGAGTNQAAPVIPQMAKLSRAERYMYIPAASSEHALAATPPIVNGFVSLSKVVTGMPCGGCAGNPPQAGSLGISFPAPYLSHTAAYQLTYTFYNVSEGSSACSLVFNINQGTTSLLHHTFNITLGGNGQYVYFIQGTLPSNAAPGAASSNAKLTCGSFSGPLASQQDYFF